MDRTRGANRYFVSTGDQLLNLNDVIHNCDLYLQSFKGQIRNFESGGLQLPECDIPGGPKELAGQRASLGVAREYELEVRSPVCLSWG